MRILHPSRLAAFGALAVLFLVPALASGQDPEAELVAIDDARVAAMLSADENALRSLLSDELRYAHSNGAVDSKEKFLDTLLGGSLNYLGYDHIERSFTFPVADLALMSGRARIRAKTPEVSVDSVLAYLAVWRKEGDQWRFLAWQSCRVPTETP